VEKLVRIVMGVALALALKEGLKVFETSGLHVDLVLDALRSFFRRIFGGVSLSVAL
jgi:hypothetical protein